MHWRMARALGKGQNSPNVKPRVKPMPTAAPISASDLVDPFGRRITYLRLSVTDRCDFRCV